MTFFTIKKTVILFLSTALLFSLVVTNAPKALAKTYGPLEVSTTYKYSECVSKKTKSAWITIYDGGIWRKLSKASIIRKKSQNCTKKNPYLLNAKITTPAIAGEYKIRLEYKEGKKNRKNPVETLQVAAPEQTAEPVPAPAPAPVPAPVPSPSPSPPSGSLTPQEYAYLTGMMDFFLDYMSTSELLHICLGMYNQPYLLPSFYSDLAQNGVNLYAISYSSALSIAEASFEVSCTTVGIYIG